MSFQNSKSRARSASVTMKRLSWITCFGFRMKTNIVSCYHCLYHQPLAHVLLQQDAATDRCRRSSYSKSLMHSVFQAHQSRRVRSLLTWFCHEALHDGAVPLPVSLTFWSSCSSAWLSFPVRGNWVVAALLGLQKPHDAFVFGPVISIDFGFSVLMFLDMRA